jgi:hypothetical protein
MIEKLILQAVHLNEKLFDLLIETLLNLSAVLTRAA